MRKAQTGGAVFGLHLTQGSRNGRKAIRAWNQPPRGACAILSRPCPFTRVSLPRLRAILPLFLGPKATNGDALLFFKCSVYGPFPSISNIFPTVQPRRIGAGGPFSS